MHFYHISPAAHDFDVENIKKAIEIVKTNFGGKEGIVEGGVATVYYTEAEIPSEDQRRLGLVEVGSAAKL